MLPSSVFIHHIAVFLDTRSITRAASSCHEWRHDINTSYPLWSKRLQARYGRVNPRVTFVALWKEEQMKHTTNLLQECERWERESFNASAGHFVKHWTNIRSMLFVVLCVQTFGLMVLDRFVAWRLSHWCVWGSFTLTCMVSCADLAIKVGVSVYAFHLSVYYSSPLRHAVADWVAHLICVCLFIGWITGFVLVPFALPVLCVIIYTMWTIDMLQIPRGTVYLLRNHLFSNTTYDGLNSIAIWWSMVKYFMAMMMLGLVSIADVLVFFDRWITERCLTVLSGFFMCVWILQSGWCFWHLESIYNGKLELAGSVTLAVIFLSNLVACWFPECRYWLMCLLLSYWLILQGWLWRKAKKLTGRPEPFRVPIAAQFPRNPFIQ